MTPSSNSEARKRAETRPSGDPVDALRDIADEISESCEVPNSWLAAVANRLDRLADQVVPRPPTVSEIIAHLDAGGVEEAWLPRCGWCESCDEAEFWSAFLDDEGDQLAYGFRLVPIPAPATERVRLDQVIGRRLPGDPDTHVGGIISTVRGFEWRDGHGWWSTLDVATDGTVEVLVEDES